MFVTSVRHCLQLIVLLAFSITITTVAAKASCTADLTLRNTGSHPLRVVTDEVQMRRHQTLLGRSDILLGMLNDAWLPWRRVRQGGWMPNRAELVIPAGGTRTSPYRARAGCDRRREVRVPYTCAGGPRGGRSYEVQQYWGPGWYEVALGRC